MDDSANLNEDVTNKLSDAAKRALKEAQDRRKLASENDSVRKSVEIGGRGGEDPTRFGDWEIKGRAIDF